MSGRARPLALGLLILALAPVASARAAGSAAESRGAPTQDGWWNRLQGPAEGEPEGNPVRPLVPPVPKPPNVPGDTIVTSAGAGQVDKVAAVGIGLALAEGATLDGLTLRLKESPVNGANVGSEGAKVTACPASGGGNSTDPFAYPSGQATFAAAAPSGSGTGLPPAPAQVALAVSPGRQGPILRARPAVDFWEHVPAFTALLVPVALGLAVLIGVVLGPTARPSAVFRPEG